MKVPYNIKRISIIISLIVLFISAMSVISIFYVTNKLQDRVAVQQLQMYLDRVELENQIENNNLLLTLNIAKSWVNNGLLRNRDFDNLNDKFISLIANTPQVSAISFVRSTGETYSLSYDSTYSEAYLAKNDSIDRANVLLIRGVNGLKLFSDTLIQNKVTALPNFISQLKIKPDSVVRYPIQNIPGMSQFAGVCFSVSTFDSINNEKYILSAYMSVKQIYNFMASIKLTETSEVHLFTADGRYFDYRKLDLINSNSAKVESYLTSWEEAKGTAFYEALHKWNLERKSDTLDFFDFKFGDKEYWAAFKPSKDSANGIWTALLMPEADFSVILKGRLRFVLFFSIILLAVSVVIIIFAIKYFNGNSSFDSLSGLELQDLINIGENEFVEFKSTIRMNLHANKPGKEIELAWLKSVVAFCNSEGGRILIGVKDNGDINGLDEDRFPNEDKTLLHVQNLIKQHIGLEFTKYINYSLRELEAKKILVIRCNPLAKPVFLRFNDKEQFFVRSGPASIELPVSKALEYIKDRDK